MPRRALGMGIGACIAVATASLALTALHLGRASAASASRTDGPSPPRATPGIEAPSLSGGGPIQPAPRLTISSDRCLLEGKAVDADVPMRRGLGRIRAEWRAFHPDEPFPGLVSLEVDARTPLPRVARILGSAARGGFRRAQILFFGESLECAVLERPTHVARHAVTVEIVSLDLPHGYAVHASLGGTLAVLRRRIEAVPRGHEVLFEPVPNSTYGDLARAALEAHSLGRRVLFAAPY